MAADDQRRVSAEPRRLISSTCVQNEVLGTTDFIDKGGSVRVLRTQRAAALLH